MTDRSNIPLPALTLRSMFFFFFLIASITASPLCSSDIESLVNSALSSSPYLSSARWGIHIAQPLSSSHPSYSDVYALNSDLLLMPASNIKLFTSAATFQYFGPSYTFNTSIYGDLNAGIMCIKAAGDPTLSSDSLAQLVSNALTISASQWAQNISSIILDQTLFGSAPSVPGTWEIADIQDGEDGAQINAFMIDSNSAILTLIPGLTPGSAITAYINTNNNPSLNQCLLSSIDYSTLTTGISSSIPSISTTYPSPFSSLLQVTGSLPAAGKPFSLSIVIPDPASCGLLIASNAVSSTTSQPTTATKIGQCPPSASTLLATQVSSPLASIMNDTLQQSINQNAEAFLRLLGAYSSSSSSSQDTSVLGVRAVSNTLSATFNQSFSAYQLNQEDGSGLSRHNLVSPRAIVSLLASLQSTWPSSTFRQYESLLPLAGRTGSLSNRFIGTKAEGRVFAKTGTMTGVTSLSGFIHQDSSTSRTSPSLIFSIIVNDAATTATTLRNAIDSIVVALMDYDPSCPICPNSCSGQGTCQQGVCVCNSGWESSDCSIWTQEARQHLTIIILSSVLGAVIAWAAAVTFLWRRAKTRYSYEQISIQSF